MTISIKIPRLGATMTEGVIDKWLVEDGAHVMKGEPIFVVATDKVENEIESPADGRLRWIGEEGVTYPVGTEIGILE